MPTTDSERASVTLRHASVEASRSDTLRARIEAEYREMPGLTLTLSQASRLWGLTAPHLERLMSALVDEGFLRRDARGAYRRNGAPRCS